MNQRKWALISVYDKTGVVEDARRLVALGWEIISSGGTAKVLKEAGIVVKDVAELVGGGAILGHRVVTLSREVHAGLLADASKAEDLAELVSLNIPFIDFVRCDFYPLQQTITVPKATIDSVVEKTDIGGPCMVRSAAKGLRIVVCRKEDMEPVLLELEANGEVLYETRQELRARAEYEVARYVGHSAVYHSGGRFQNISGERVAVPLYGENGHQNPAGLYSAGTNDPLSLDKFQVIEGKAPSYNNWCDLDRLLQTLTHMATGYMLNFGRVPAVGVGVKHGNPCGAAFGFNPDATVSAVARGDLRAIFGGSLIFNFPINGELAETLGEDAAADGQSKQLFDCVVAPSFDEDAVAVFKRRSDKCRLIINPALCGNPGFLDFAPRFRYVRGGFLKQPNYEYVLDIGDPELKIFGPSNERAQKDLILAWAVGCTSNSNTITIANNGMLLGNGVGQQDRVGAAELAIKRSIDAGHKKELIGSVAYSDSFFPFPDAVEVLIRAGVGAIFSTSGSINDGKVQELCVKRGVTLFQLPDKKARGFFGH